MVNLLMLLALISIEIILFYSTKKLGYFKYKQIRNIRIIIMTVILVLILLGVLTWGFRYYGLLIVLFLMIIVKHIKSLNNKCSNHREYSLSKKQTLIRILLLTVIMLPSLLFPEYKPLDVTGSYQVNTNTYIFEDENRIETFSNQNDFRQVGIHIWYPESDELQEKFPLIVYSHGGISLNTSNESLFRELASQGYIVFSIDHFYHSILAKNNDNKNIWINNGYMKELNQENAKENPEDSLLLYQKWMEIRTGDINFIIDYTKVQIQEVNSIDIFKRIDIDNIGVIGHSLGGSAALCIGRVRGDIKAIIALESPYMCDIKDVENDEFIFEHDSYPVPVLNIYSDSSWDQLSKLPQYQQNHFMLSDTDSIVRNLYIDGTGHFSLTDLSLTSPLLTRMLNGFHSNRNSREVLYLINDESLNFLNEHLKNYE